MAESIMEGIIELTNADGLKTIKGMIWERKVDDKWYVAVNGKGEVGKVTPEGSMEIDLQPYYVAVWYNGWLAGLFHPAAGGMIAAGEGANEDTLIAALNAATKKTLAARKVGLSGRLSNLNA